MITTEEISIRVYHLLQESEVKSIITGSIDYERSDYTKEDVIVVPHAITGEDSVRFGQINVNIHVPDLVVKSDKNPVYKINYPRLIDIRAKAIEVLRNHYEPGKGYNWTIGFLNPPIKEPEHNEHFVTLALELTVRNKKSN
jgi:hypothetical protein